MVADPPLALDSAMAIFAISALDLIGDTDAGTLARGEAQSPELWADLVRWIRETSGLSAMLLGRRVGVDGRTVRRWTAAEEIPSPPARRLLLGLAREIVLRDDRPNY